jgi:hypothetical protein
MSTWIFAKYCQLYFSYRYCNCRPHSVSFMYCIILLLKVGSLCGPTSSDKNVSSGIAGPGVEVLSVPSSADKEQQGAGSSKAAAAVPADEILAMRLQDVSTDRTRTFNSMYWLVS